ncbi:MAG: collagen-like protein [Deltaproteobacteria bacterium]|nr:collagen-like protein [Deltaproteobacteria bacterium]
MHRHWLSVVILGLLMGLCSRVNADVLCRDQNGAVFVRETCRKAETRLSVTALGLVGAPGPKGEKGERGLRGQQGASSALGATMPPQPAPLDAGDPQTGLLWWQGWLLVVTAGVIGFYTIETSKRRREAERQSELQLQPFVIFEPGEGKDFCVRNIGNHTALNVRVGTFALCPPVMAAFPRAVAFLRQGESRSLQGHAVPVEGAVMDDARFEILRPGSAFEKFDGDSFRPTITIEFENVNRQRYCVQESLHHGDMEILHFGLLTPPSSSRKLQAAWQELWTVGQKLREAGQKLWQTWQQRKGRKQESVTASTTLDEHEWVDGR